jgi:hypothetical protein
MSGIRENQDVIRTNSRQTPETVILSTAQRFSSTYQFTRRGRCNGVVSRETRMRPRSRCNAWFGGSFADPA